MSGRSKITGKQEALIAALLTEPTHAAAASKAGISEATLHRWLHRPEFQAAHRQARRSLVEAAIARLQQSASKAVEALERNLTCGQPSHEIRAALGILEHAVEGIELLDVVQRVEELEHLLKELRGEDSHETPRAPAARSARPGQTTPSCDPLSPVCDRDVGGVTPAGR